MTQKKYHIITYGCQMNVNDSERIAALLEKIGMRHAAAPESADFILINTCSVRQSAEDRVFGQVRNFEKLKKGNPRLRVALTGCMPGRDHDGSLRAKLPLADFFFPIHDLPRLPSLLAQNWSEEVPSRPASDDYFDIMPKRHSRSRAYVTIQSGCNNFCTFCVVPYARGRERSRPVQNILSEVSALAKKGILEITLLGQNVNAYHPPDIDRFSKKNPFRDSFAALLWEVNEIPGIRRIRFTAPNPQDMTDEAIEALGLEKQVNYLHLPVQSGSDDILRRMNRRYTREKYLAIIEKVRAIRPSIALGTDIIVGFCGETNEHFEETLSLYREARFDIAYLARYSPRHRTLAAKLWQDSVPQEEKKSRWFILQGLMEQIALEKNRLYEGKTVEVLADALERVSSTLPIVRSHSDDVLLSGNSREMKRVKFFGPATLKDKIVPVHITHAQEWILWGNRK